MRSESGLRVTGLFAGVGGLELGLSRAGHKTIRLCESAPAARAVLQERFDGVEVDEDIRDLGRLPPATQILAAGFPCQDLSQVGTRNGINGEKSGVVSHVFRLLKRKRVPWVLLENVPFMLRLNRGAAIRYLVEQLEELGYRWAYRVVDSRAFGLPQRRLRVYLLASRKSNPTAALLNPDATDSLPTALDGRACGFYWTEGNRGLGWAVDAIPPLKGGSEFGIPSAPAIWLPDGRIVTPDIRDAERLQGFRADWTKPALNVAKPGERWRLVGNAVTVEVAKWLGGCIGRTESRLRHESSVLSNGDPWPSAAYGSPSSGRYAVRVSSWPVSRRCVPLADFLRFEPRLLSAKALAGFTDRLKRSSLRYPGEFLEVLEANLKARQNGAG